MPPSTHPLPAIPLTHLGVYVVTGREICSNLAWEELFRGLLEGGCRLIQLRAKGMSPLALETLAADCVAQCAKAGAKLIINDDPALALRVGAAGAHIGQGDMDPCRARDILGPNLILGISTHNGAQARNAAELHERAGGRLFDYLAIGPLFPTATKADHDPVTGLDMVTRDIRPVWSGPLVGIGGVNAERFRAVAASGIDLPAVVGAAMGPSADVIASRMRALSQTWQQALEQRGEGRR